MTLEPTGMTPVLVSSFRTLASSESVSAARIVQWAAEALAEEATQAADVNRYLRAADRIADALDLPRLSRRRLLQASPAVTEISGRSRTLIEMIEAEPDNESDRLRLAKILFRALLWQPETFPNPLD